MNNSTDTNRFIEKLASFSTRYNEYICRDIIRSGQYVNDYQCSSQEVVDYIVGHTRSNKIEGPFMLDYHNIFHLDSQILARIIINDNVINQHILVFIKNPNEVLVGQSTQGILAFNYKMMSLTELYNNINYTMNNRNLSKLSGIGIRLNDPVIAIQYYVMGDIVELELPMFSRMENNIINKLREEFIESTNASDIPYLIMGNVITELDNAIYLRVNLQHIKMRISTNSANALH